jgi:phospholipid/cholesterol/gamma-HCH transport system substrate-binding protein
MGHDHPGELVEAARTIRSAVENLDKRTGDIATGLSRFTASGLKEWEKLAVDGRRTLAEVERTVKNIDRNPSRLLWGGGPPAPETTGAVSRR